MLSSLFALARRGYNGAVMGLLVGAFFSALPILGALLEGTTELRLRGGRLTVNAIEMVAALLVGATCSGALVALLVPLATTRLRAAVVGVLAIYPYSFLVSLALRPAAYVSPLTLAAIISLGLGGCTGALVWSSSVEDRTAPDR